MEDDLRWLIERHCRTIRQLVDTVGRNLDLSCNSSVDSRKPLVQAERLAHQLKGSSGSLGFPQVSTAAAALDDHLKYLFATGGAMTNEDVERLFGLYDELKKTARSISPQNSKLCSMTQAALIHPPGEAH